MFESGTWNEGLAHLLPGDLLLLYSDGASELFDQNNNELGIPGLQELARVRIDSSANHDLDLEALSEQLLGYTDQIHLPDDLTLMKLRCKA